MSLIVGISQHPTGAGQYGKAGRTAWTRQQPSGSLPMQIWEILGKKLDRLTAIFMGRDEGFVISPGNRHMAPNRGITKHPTKRGEATESWSIALAVSGLPCSITHERLVSR